MSDFEEFSSAEQPPVVEEDPAAAFLAREQDDLAALEGDDELTTGATQNTDADFAAEDDFGSQEPSAQPSSAADAGMFDPLGDDQQPTEGTDTAFVTSHTQDSFGVEVPNLDPYTAIKQADVLKQEPEKILLWRLKQEEDLEKKDEESKEKEGDWRQVAKKELEDWYKHRTEQLEKTKLNNSESEQAFVTERDESVPGHEWERICRVCEFNPKTSRMNKDVSRMRSILLQLKQTPLQRS